MFETQIIPRVSETDGAGHINNTVIPIWFEAGRNEVFKLITPSLSFNDWRLALVNMNVDYLAQTYYQDKVSVRTWIEKLGNKSFVIYEELHQNGTLCAKGTATYVYFNYETQRSEPLPNDVKAKLADHIKHVEELLSDT